MTNICIDQNSGNILIKTDNLVVKSLLEVKRTVAKYVFGREHIVMLKKL